MDLFEMYKKSTLEAALNEFGEKYHDFCNDHTCATCVLAADKPTISPLNWRQQCKAYVIDHLTEANQKMDEIIAKEKEAKRKKDEYAQKFLLAIKDRKRDLEYHAKCDADYVILNSGDYALLKSRTTGPAICLTCGSDICYETIYGMRIVCDISIKRGEFVIGFKTNSHIKEANNEQN